MCIGKFCSTSTMFVAVVWAANLAWANPGSRDAATAPPTASSEVSKRLLEAFRRTYALPDDKVVKRVVPPFSPGRLEYYRVRHAQQAQYIPQGPDFMWFHWGDCQSRGADGSREGMLSQGGMFGDGRGGRSIAGLVEDVTHIKPYEMLGDRKLMDTHVYGDWVFRDNVPAEKLLREFEAVLRTECKVPVRFRLIQKERQVIVAEGQYAFHPLPGNTGITDEAGVTWDRLDVFEKDRPPDKDRHVNEWGGNLGEVFYIIGLFINRPVINEAKCLPKAPVCCRYDTRRLDECRTKGGASETAILKNLSWQTSLRFSDKTRRVRVLLVERAD